MNRKTYDLALMRKQLYWLAKMSRYSRAMEDELVRLRNSGAVRALAVSIHDRPRAGCYRSSSLTAGSPISREQRDGEWPVRAVTATA